MTKKKAKAKASKVRTKAKKSAPKKKVISRSKNLKSGAPRLKPIPGQPATLIVAAPQKKLVGHVAHYFPKIGVGIIELTGGDLALGDEISIEGMHTNIQQRVDSLQIEHKAVNIARIGESAGTKVKDRVRENDVVYKVIRKI